jgi:hypothetical protein
MWRERVLAAIGEARLPMAYQLDLFDEVAS